jgi:hypothetical protein
MIVPPTIKIAGVRYIIKMNPHLNYESGASGRSLLCSGIIEIDDLMCIDIKNASLIHEIFEIIKAENELHMTHRALQTMATQFYQVVVDNPDLFKCA